MCSIPGAMNSDFGVEVVFVVCDEVIVAARQTLTSRLIRWLRPTERPKVEHFRKGRVFIVSNLIVMTHVRNTMLAHIAFRAGNKIKCLGCGSKYLAPNRARNEVCGLQAQPSPIFGRGD